MSPTTPPPGDRNARAPILALCWRGWHARLNEDGLTYVRFATRLRDDRDTFIYRVGPVPDEAQCVTIWCYGDQGVAWRCSLCGRSIIGLDA